MKIVRVCSMLLCTTVLLLRSLTRMGEIVTTMKNSSLPVCLLYWEPNTRKSSFICFQIKIKEEEAFLCLTIGEGSRRAWFYSPICHIFAWILGQDLPSVWLSFPISMYGNNNILPTSQGCYGTKFILKCFRIFRNKEFKKHITVL